MKSTLFALAAVSAMAFHAPLAAQQEAKDKGADTTLSQVDPATIGSLEVSELTKIIAHPDHRWLKRPCDLGQPVMAELLRRQPNERAFQRGHLLTAVYCATERKEYRAALDDLARLESENEGGFDDLALYLEARLDDGEAALARLTRLVRTNGGAGLNTISQARFWQAGRLLIKQGREKEWGDLKLEVFRSSGFAQLDRELRQGVAYGAILPAIEHDMAYLVPKMLLLVPRPTSYVAMLSERRYEAAWPFIERHAGPNLATVSSANLAEARARLAEEPSDRERIKDLAHALHYDGRFEENADLAAALVKEIDAGRAIEEDDGWALNTAAYSLDGLGRRAEGDALFDRLATLDAKDNPWVVNFVINRAIRLANQRRWAEALSAAELAARVAETKGSTYAQMLVALTRSCALAKLGRGAEGAKDLSFLTDHGDDAVGITAQGLICAGQSDAAAALLVGALGRNATRANAIDALQEQSFSFLSVDEGIAPARVLLAGHPELVAAYRAVARDVPREFIPRGAQRRAELAGTK